MPGSHPRDVIFQTRTPAAQGNMRHLQVSGAPLPLYLRLLVTAQAFTHELLPILALQGLLCLTPNEPGVTPSRSVKCQSFSVTMLGQRPRREGAMAKKGASVGRRNGGRW